MVKPTLEPGATIDGFRIEERLHQGGMATLWRVSRADETMPMLMKVPNHHRRRRSRGDRQLRDGADDPAAAVAAYTFQSSWPPATSRVQPYIVMERISGHNAVDTARRAAAALDEVAEIGLKIAAALDDLHRQHVIHLDIKPSNIMFRPTGEAVLLDFGLSHHDQLPDLMKEEFRVPFGTAPYMSPEQLLGVRNDPRSDLFALGVLLYFFSTGVRPFGESETMYGMRRRLWRDPVPPRN